MFLPISLIFPFLFPIMATAQSSKNSLSTSSPANSKSICSDRCNRLLSRSLHRLDPSLGVDEVLHRIGSFRKTQMMNGRSQDSSEELELPAKDFKDICWKFFDFEDCQKQCQKVFKGRRKRRKRKEEKGMAVMEPENRVILHFCRRADFGVSLEHFACLHKYHSFIEVHCSTYQQRAVQLRLIGLQLEQNDKIDANKFGGKKALERLKKAIDQELCLLLHQHSSCLVNSGARFCPKLRSNHPSILNRSTLREHFLSLLLPFGRAIDQNNGQKMEPDSPVELDQLFPDLLLDHCQLFDFHKMAKEWMERMQNGGGKEGAQREFEPSTADGEEGGQMDEDGEQRSTTKRAVWPKTFGSDDDEEGDMEVTVAPANRRVFSSEEDLEDTPPNFFYSTARLPKDFYTRYAIWWGSRGEKRKSLENSEEELTAVQLWPTATTSPSPPRAHSQLILNSNDGRTTIWKEQIGPDLTLSTPNPQIWDGNADVGLTQTLPYFVNGRMTTPVERWPGEVTTTEIELIDGTRRKVWTANEEEEAEWKRREAKEMERRNREEEINREEEEEEGRRPFKETTTIKQQNPIEEYEEEWAYEDEFDSSQFEDEDGEGNVRMLKPVTNEIGNVGPFHYSTTPEPMFRETNIYFAKILEFGQEPEADAEWMHSGKDSSSPKTIAHMIHYPGDQLPPIRKKEMPKSAELEADDWDRKRQNGQQNPYEILAADPSQFMIGPKTTTPINWRTGVPYESSSTPNSDRPKIFVSAEPVPAKKSETLLVLLGIYLTFFAIASFFLFCLVLTCLERNRRNASRRRSAKMSTGSAILYIDEKDGTLKDNSEYCPSTFSHHVSSIKSSGPINNNANEFQQIHPFPSNLPLK